MIPNYDHSQQLKPVLGKQKRKRERRTLGASQRLFSLQWLRPPDALSQRSQRRAMAPAFTGAPEHRGLSVSIFHSSRKTRRKQGRGEGMPPSHARPCAFLPLSLTPPSKGCSWEGPDKEAGRQERRVGQGKHIDAGVLGLVWTSRSPRPALVGST